MITQLINKKIIKILTYLLISPGSKYKRKELKEKIGMNNLPLDAGLRKLQSLKILTKKKNLYALSYENEAMQLLLEQLREEYVNYNLPHNIFNLLVELADELTKIKEIDKVYLFGSYAKLIYTSQSDIDLAIITKKELSTNKQKVIRRQLETKAEKYKKKLDIHFFQETDLKQKDALIQDILRNGKQLF